MQAIETPFLVPTLEADYLHVSSKIHIEQLSKAPEETLSLNALAEDVSIAVIHLLCLSGIAH